MNQLVEKLVETEHWAAVQEQCERWLSMSRASEPAYRALMIAYSARGDITKANAIYQRCAEELLEQLGVEPSVETQTLYQGLLKGGRVHSIYIQGRCSFGSSRKIKLPQAVFISKPIAPIFEITFSPDSRYIVICSEDQTAPIWDLTTGQEIRKLAGHHAPIISARHYRK